MILRPPPSVFIGAHAILSRSRYKVGCPDKLPCIAVGKCSKKDSVYHRENGGVGADAEGERENGDSSEGGRLPQHAEAVTAVRKKVLKPNAAPHFACVFLDARHVAELVHSR